MFLEIQYTDKSNKNTSNNNKNLYFKLLYIGTFLNTTKIYDKYCKNINIIVIFVPLKIGHISCKDYIPNFLQSYVVCQFTGTSLLLWQNQSQLEN